MINVTSIVSRITKKIVVLAILPNELASEYSRAHQLCNLRPSPTLSDSVTFLLRTYCKRQASGQTV